jgi:hypothetical protein
MARHDHTGREHAGQRAEQQFPGRDEFLSDEHQLYVVWGELHDHAEQSGQHGPDGAVYLALEQDSTEETGLNTNITNEDKSISTQQTQLTTELNAANYTLEEIPEQLQSVNELYSAITGYDENPGG